MPAPDAPDWNVQINHDLAQLDLLLSGNLPIPGLNIAGTAIIPLLSTYSPLVTYTVGQTIIAAGALYVSLINANLANPPATSGFAWTPTIASSLPQAPQRKCWLLPPTPQA